MIFFLPIFLNPYVELLGKKQMWINKQTNMRIAKNIMEWLIIISSLFLFQNLPL